MGPLGGVLLFIPAWLVAIPSTFGVALLLIPVYWSFVFKDGDKRKEQAFKKLSTALMEQEQLLHAAFQLRLLALAARRKLIAVTNSRMIIIQRSWFGGFTMKDYQWKDLRDAQLSENILPQWFGSNLTFVLGMAPPMVIDGLLGDEASSIYKHAQQQEQAWEEKRRIRKLEERRASSGGIVMKSGGTAAGGASTGGALEELDKAKKLLDTGVISDAEFQEIKAKILSGGMF